MVGSYSRYFGFLRWVGRHFESPFLINCCIFCIGIWISPFWEHRRQWLEVWGRHLGRKQKPGVLAWFDFLRRGCLAAILLYRVGHFPDRYSVSVVGDVPKGAAVVLTYHHHFAYLFCIYLGWMGPRVDIVTADPRKSPLGPLFDEYGACWFEDSLVHLHGGKWIFTNFDGVNDLRSMIACVKQGGCLCVAHDVQNVYLASKGVSAEIFDKKFEAPGGAIRMAVRNGIPVHVGWVEPDGMGLKFKIRCLWDGVEADRSAESILNDYMKCLEEMLHLTPQFWEGWAMLISLD